MLLANQHLITRQESNFGGNNVSFEMNFRENKIFKFVYLAAKSFSFFFLFHFFFTDSELPRNSDVSFKQMIVFHHMYHYYKFHYLRLNGPLWWGDQCYHE